MKSNESLLAQLRIVYELGRVHDSPEVDRIRRLVEAKGTIDQLLFDMIKGGARPTIRAALKEDPSIKREEIEARYLSEVLSMPGIADFVEERTGRDLRNIELATLTAGRYLNLGDYKGTPGNGKELALRTKDGIVIEGLTAEQVVAPFKAYFDEVWERDARKIKNNLKAEIEKRAIATYRAAHEYGAKRDNGKRKGKGKIIEVEREDSRASREPKKKSHSFYKVVGDAAMILLACGIGAIGAYVAGDRIAERIGYTVAKTPLAYGAPKKTEKEITGLIAEKETNAENEAKKADERSITEASKGEAPQDVKIKPVEDFDITRITEEEIRIAPYTTKSYVRFGYTEGELRESEVIRFEKVLNDIVESAYQKLYEKQKGKKSKEDFLKGVRFEIHYTAKTSIDGKFTGYDNDALAERRRASTEDAIRKLMKNLGFEESQYKIKSDNAPEVISKEDFMLIEAAAKEKGMDVATFVQSFNAGGYKRNPGDISTMLKVEGILGQYRESDIDRIMITTNNEKR